MKLNLQHIQKDKSYFSKMFYRIAIMVCIVITILTATLYFYSSATILKMVYLTNIKFFSQISYTSNHINDQIKNNLLYMSVNEKITCITTEKEPSIIDIQDAFSQIDFTTNSNPLIQSTYLYNGKNDTYYVKGKNGCIRKSTFYDSEIVKILNNIDDYDTTQPFYRTIPISEFESENKIDVLSYILRENF